MAHTPADLGRLLARVREGADIKQGELAKRMGISAALLSRMESGERPPTLDEAVAALRQLTSPQASKLLAALEREWKVLAAPALDHPDQELLFEAEQVGRELLELRDRPGLSHAFVTRVERYLAEVRSAASLLLKREHQISFVGPVGVGKSTAICHGTGMILRRDDGRVLPVLADGAGGTTLCEVHIRGGGPGYGIVIEPRSVEEIHEDVRDFVDFLLRDSASGASDRRGEGQATSKEIARAIRNMSRLPGPSVKDKRDYAKELTSTADSARSAVVEMISRMTLHTRDRRQVWYDSAVAKAPLDWLRDEFRRINNGTNPEFTIPRRIELVVKEPLLEFPGLSVRLIDTKGIDGSAAREDLETYLQDPHSLTVICSRFNDAPGAAAHQLIERAIERGNREMNVRSCVVVLAHTGEPLAMTDDASGEQVGDVPEGYELKRAHAEMNMAPFGLREYPMGFYDCHSDAPEVLRDFLAARVSTARDSFGQKLRVAMEGSRELIRNHGEAEVQVVLEEASARLRDWLRVNGGRPELAGNAHDSLVSEISAVHPAAIYAAVRRGGEWENFSYSYHVGHGARRLAVSALGKRVEGFAEFCRVLAASPGYVFAKELFNQAERALLDAFDDLQQRVQIMGRTASAGHLKSAGELWDKSAREWGQSRGFRQAVAGFTRDWFMGDALKSLEADVKTSIESEWTRAVEGVANLVGHSSRQL